MLELIRKLLDTVVNACFYGTVALQFQAGKLVHVQVVRDIKPEDIN